jgi:hypothetical protein
MAERNETTTNLSAYLASLAAQTLFSRMSGAFVEAFKGPDGSMDSTKVVQVLEGRASVKIVEHDRHRTDELESGMAGLNLAGGGGGGRECSFDDVCKRWMGKKSPAPSS